MPTPTTAAGQGGEICLRFGIHKGKRVRDLPQGYLYWLANDARQLPPQLLLAAQVELSRRLLVRRAEADAIAARLLPLPRAEPQTVHGVELSAEESALFLEAVRSGRLPVLPPWLPCSSKLAEAWELHRLHQDDGFPFGALA